MEMALFLLIGLMLGHLTGYIHGMHKAAGLVRNHFRK